MQVDLSCLWRDVREVEGARLEIVCTANQYHGFESHSLRQHPASQTKTRLACFFNAVLDVTCLHGSGQNSIKKTKHDFHALQGDGGEAAKKWPPRANVT